MEPGTPRDEASRLLTWLQANGAIVEINADGNLWVDLNPVACITNWEAADAVSTSVLALREEIKALLRAQETVH